VTTTPDAVRDQLLEEALTGEAEIQIGDRRIRKFTPAERLAAIQQIDSSTKSPFIKVGMKARTI
jgi:hypothetical protein